MRLFLLTILSMAMVNVFAQAPQLTVNRESISTSVANGGTTTQTFIITNTGNRDLNWNLKTKGVPVQFTKPAYADWTQASKQDRITPSVWITRQNNQGIFNIASQSAFNSSAPAGTQWAFGKSEDLDPTDYTTWQSAVSSNPQSMINNVISMRTVAEDRYFDITFQSFAGNNSGGEFSYTRVEYNLGWTSADFTSGTLIPGQSKTVTVTFDASELVGGGASGFVVVESNDPVNAEKAIALHLNIVDPSGTPELTAPASKDLGEGFVTFASQKTITINNTGTGLLTISNVVSSNPAFVPETNSFNISPGQGYDLRVQFLPTVSGTITGDVTLTSNDADESTFVIDVTADAENAPVSGVGATSLTATLASGAQSQQTLLISNTGEADLIYQVSFNLGRSIPVSFSKINFKDPMLPEHQDRVSPNVVLTRADERGLFNAAVEASFNSSVSPQNTTWASSSTATATSYTTWRNAMDSDPRDMVDQVTSMFLPLENRYFDVVLKQWTCCENGGGFTYERTEVYNWLTASLSGNTLVGGDAETIYLDFNATGLPAGTYNGTFIITSNDPAMPVRNIPVTFTVTGSAVARFHESTLVFDNTAVGLSSRKKFRVINDGATPLTVSNVTYGDGEFVTFEGTGTIAPFSAGVFEVTFTPTAVESYSGVVTLTTNDPANPTMTLPYLAEGVEPGEINVIASGMNAEIETGEIITRTITIENTGSGDIHWSAAMQNTNPVVTFSKADYADYKLAENQDRIAPQVWITRQDNRGLYNIATESSYQEDVSPIGTEWQFGSTFTADNFDYEAWEDAIDGDPLEAINQTYSVHTGNEFYDLTMRSWTSNNQGGGFSYDRQKAAGWIKLDSYEGTILPGASATITVTYNSRDYVSSTKNETLVITSDDPNEAQTLVPIQLTIIGAPVIEASVTDLNFGDTGIGFNKTLPITISNTGTDVLNISSIVSSNPAFTVEPAVANVPVNGKLVVNVKFTPGAIQSYTGDIQIASNDINTGVVTINLTGAGIQVPDIAVTPAEIIHKTTSTSVFNGTIEIQNSGLAPLNWASGRASSYPLEDLLTNLNTNFADVTALIPSMYTFNYDGGNNYSISDGGNDMYDGGNILNTNLSGTVQYSNNAITAGDTYFGTGSRYFTRHLNGLFVMIADMNNVSNFSITGNNGADGSGSTNSAVLTTSINGTSYTGYLKRVYGTSDPSINQLMIVESDASITQNASTNTDDSYHEISNTNAVKRVYYLLYASASGGLIDNTTSQSIMEEFLNVISGGNGFLADWVTLDTYSGTVAPGATQTVNYTLDLTSFPDANYTTSIPVSSNDPDESLITIPVEINIGAVIVANEISDMVVNEGFASKVIDFSNTFIDGNNDALTFAVGSNLQVVSGSITGTSLTLTEVAPGSSIISLRAQDANNNVVYEDFNFRVNDVPTVDKPVNDVVVTYGFTSTTVDVAEVFVDTDEDDVVTLSVASSNPAIVGASIANGIITITEGVVGNATITLTANDGIGGIATETFTVTVNKAAATVALSNTTATYNGTAKAVTASTTPANLSVAIVYAQNGTAVASPVNAGTYDVTATINDASYQGSTTGTLTINKADQTITFSDIASVMNSNAPITLTATSSAGLPVTFTKVSGPITVAGNTVTLTGDVGTATIEANQAGNANYNAAAPVQKSVTITQDPILSVDDAFSAHVQAYPVPAKEYMTVSTGSYTILNVSLSDAFGRKVYAAQPNRSEHTISTSGYAQGVYILQVKTEKGLVSRKIQVVK